MWKNVQEHECCVSFLMQSGLLLTLLGPCTFTWTAVAADVNDNAEPSITAEEKTSLSASSLETARMSAGFGMGYFNSDYAKAFNGTGKFGPAVNASFSHRIGSVPVYAGLDFGVNFWTYQTTSQGSASIEHGAYGISLLPSVIYRVKFPKQPMLAPYIGFSIGPHFFILKDTAVNPSQGTVSTSSTTYVYFQFMARPGLDLVISDGIGVNFESKFGFLGADFIWLPQANIAILL
jgi:hypothetical protein